jgi:glycosyltransferase involved in cell wall biosynthesis
MPIKITDLELSQEITPLAVDGYNGVCALVRYHGRPIGWINSDSPLSSVLSIESVTRAVDDQVGWQCIQAVLGAVPGNAEPQSNGLPAVSVIVCIDDSISRISKVLHHLHHLEYPEYEVLLIDYGTVPRDRSEWQTYSTVRYIRCEHASLACARNRGIVEARHSLVAFIAPHSYPDRQWLTVIGSTLVMPHVKAVTGLVAPAELETDAQIQFEHGGYGLGRGLDRRVIRRQQLGDRDLLRANGFGSGANMAFHRETLIMIGQFDPRFTVDLPSGGGEVELLHRLVARGYTLVYEPAALTWYMPRRDLETVRAQVFDQGRAFGLYLLMCFRKRTVGRLSLLRFVLRDWGWKWIALRLRRPGKATRFLVLAELAGALVSPMTLWNGRKRFGHLAADIAGQAAAETGPPPVLQLASPHAAPPPRPQTDEVGTRATIRIVRTWYPHWGQYSGINQFLKFVDAGRYRVTTQLVQENDSEFPLQSRVVREWLRYWVRRKDMAWYNLSDLRGELTTLAACFSRRELVVHYLDGEHAAQFVPRLSSLPRRVRPHLVVSYHQPPEVLDSVLRKDAVARFDRVIAVAPEQVDFLSSLTSPENVRLILHGIDTDFFQPMEKLLHDRPIRCISVGHNYRDYQTVRQVATQLRDHHHIEFYVVSPRATGLEDLSNVVLHKGVDDLGLLKLYQEADILFLPLTKATANNALLEGIACGLPVLSTLLPGVKAYLPGPEAILIERNDADRYTDALLYLVQHPDVRRTMAEAARTRALELSWSKIAPQYEVLYSELIGL